MRRLGDNGGQATVETLALVPLVVAAAFGLAACGVWIARGEQLRGRVAAGAVAAMEGGDGAALKGNALVVLRGNTGIKGTAGEASGTTGITALLPRQTESIRWPAGAAG